MPERNDKKFQDAFASVCCKLLTKSILCSDNPADRDDYKFVSDYTETLRDHFHKMGIRLEKHDSAHTVHIAAEDRDGHSLHYEKMKLEEIAIFIILYQYYRENRDPLEYVTTITRAELMARLPDFLANGKLKKDSYQKALKKLRWHSLIAIDRARDITDPDSRITIYPSILFGTDDAVTTAFYQKLKEQIESRGTGKNPAEEEDREDDEENLDDDPIDI